MGERLQYTRFGASVLALAVGLALAGCGASQGDDALPPSSSSSASGSVSSAPSNGGAQSGDGQSSSAAADPSASGDWWPEQQKTMATGQEFPADYEPATLEHPARNVPKPVMPEEANQETEAGAQAFLDYYADAGWYAYQTGDTSLMRAIVTPDCEKCLSEMDLVDEIYSKGDWAAGSDERSEIQENSFFETAGGYYSLPVNVTNNGAKLVSNGKVLQEFLPYNAPDRFNVNIKFVDGNWLYLTASPRGES